MDKLMKKLPDKLNQNYTQILLDRKLPKAEQYFCTKWLRYYGDFCYKYQHDLLIAPSLPLFLGKLQEKGNLLNNKIRLNLQLACFMG